MTEPPTVRPYRLRDRVARWGVKLLARLPFGVCGKIGAGLGRLMYWVGGREVRTAQVNLALCFPELSQRERARLVRRNLEESGRSMAQMVRLFVGRPLPLDDLIDENGFIEACRARLARGRGLILALPHQGNWELVSYRVTRAAPATALYRPSRMAALDDLVRAGRERSGIDVVPIDRQGLKRLHEALRDGEIVGILPDQVPKAAGAAGVLAPFFGRPALTMTLVNRLARRHDTPVLFCCAVAETGSKRHKFHYFDADPEIAADDPAVAAAALNRGIERCARAFPAHYQWTYRRFQIPGDPQASPYR